MRLYHNPRCSKSRQAVALLSDRNIKFEEYRYLDLGIAEEDFDLLLDLDGVIRTTDIESNTSLNLSNKEELKTLLGANPRLLERPILIHDRCAVIGRPPEKILTILD